MKRLLFMPLLAAMLTVHAQDVKEGKTLQEVTIKGSKVVQRVDGQTIYPTRQQLESSTNGYSLLSKLTLPHLRIDPVMHTVTALTNLGSVQVRINNVVASKEDLLSLDMKAVQQIDIHKNVTQHSRDFGNMLTLNVTWHLSSGRKYRDIQRTMNHRDTETGILQSK